MSLHGETAPKSWTKTQMQLRLMELEGESALEVRKGKTQTTLRMWEIKINKAARRKADLLELMANDLKMMVDSTNTIEQLKVRALNHAYLITPGEAQDFVAFGQFAHLTYQEVYDQEKNYVQWMLREVQTNDTSPKFRRLAKWMMEQEDQPVKPSLIKAKAKKEGKKVLAKASPSSSSQPQMEQMMASMMSVVQQLSAEVSELKEGSQGRRKVAGTAETSSSEWEKMTDQEPQ